MSLAAHIDEQARRVDRRPTAPQKEAGNYRKGHVRIHGLDISIENPRGSWRSGGAGPNKWRSQLPHHYGYIRKTEGGDGDHVDVYLGPHLKSPHVFVVDQHHLTGGKPFDEHKCFIGFGSEAQARAAYQKAFSDGRGKERIGHIETMTVPEFKAWLTRGDTTRPIKRARRRAEGGGVGDDYNTALSPADETAFQGWKSQNAPDDSGVDYDLRGAYQANMQRSPDNGHMGDTFKKPNHPTFSDQSQYATGDQRDRAGFWVGDEGPDQTFVPPTVKAGGGRVHMADGGTPNPFDAIDPAPASPAASANPFDAIDPPSQSSTATPPDNSWSGRLQNMWDKATPGGPLWIVKQAITAPKEAMGAAAESAEHTYGPGPATQSDSDAPFVDRLPEAAAKVAQIYSPAAPSGTGGMFAAALKSAKEIVDPIVAGNKDAAGEFGINLSRGQSAQDLDAIRYEDMASRGAYGKDQQDRAAAFFNKQHQDIQAGGQQVTGQLARETPRAENPADAAGAVSSDVADQAARAHAEQVAAEQRASAEADAQRGIVSDQGRALTDTIRGGALPIENPREAGEVVGQNVRDVAAANRQEFQARYNEFGQLPGEFRVDAVQGMGNRVKNELTFADNPVVIDDHLTPSASRAVQALDAMSQPRIQNRADPRAPPAPADITAVSLKGVDQMRKQLVAYYQAARSSGNGADIRATRAVMNEFDGQIERAITEGLFSGDPRALAALQEARASYSRYQRTYTPQGAGDDVGTAMRRIVDRNATPEETANMIVGSGKIGNAGLPVRLADRLEQVLGPNSDSWSALRQAMWQKASQVRNVAGEVDPNKSAQSIFDFTGSSLGQRMFTPQERAAMRSHAQAIRDLDRNIEQMPVTEAATRARANYQDRFGGSELGGAPKAAFQRMVEGTATPEEISNGIFKVIGAGNPGHVTRALQAVERIVGEDSPTMGAIRQGVWQKLTQAPAGKDQPGAQKTMQAINEFLNGSGKTIAENLYSPSERALMQRYADAVKLTIIPPRAATRSDTAVASFAAARKYAGMIGAALGWVHGDGGLTGYAVGKLIDKAGEKVTGMKDMRKLNDSLEDIQRAPRSMIGNRVMPNRAIRKTAPLALNLPARLQGPVPAGAEDEKKKTPWVRNQ